MLKLLKALYRVFRCIREGVVTLFFLLFVMISFAFVSLLSSFNGKAETEAIWQIIARNTPISTAC